MKKTIWAILATAALFAVCCDKEYDDSALVQRINDLEGRVTALEPLNTTVSGISAIVNALNEKDTVLGVLEVKDSEGNVIGYTINFSKSAPVTIYNGERGDRGPQGEQGEKGEKGEKGE